MPKKVLEKEERGHKKTHILQAHLASAAAFRTVASGTAAVGRMICLHRAVLCCFVSSRSCTSSACFRVFVRCAGCARFAGFAILLPQPVRSLEVALAWPHTPWAGPGLLIRISQNRTRSCCGWEFDSSDRQGSQHTLGKKRLKTTENTEKGERNKKRWRDGRMEP